MSSVEEGNALMKMQHLIMIKIPQSTKNRKGLPQLYKHLLNK